MKLGKILVGASLTLMILLSLSGVAAAHSTWFGCELAADGGYECWSSRQRYTGFQPYNYYYDNHYRGTWLNGIYVTYWGETRGQRWLGNSHIYALSETGVTNQVSFYQLGVRNRLYRVDSYGNVVQAADTGLRYGYGTNNVKSGLTALPYYSGWGYQSQGTHTFVYRAGWPQWQLKDTSIKQFPISWYRLQ